MAERKVLLMDMNAFFAAIEQQCNPWLRGKPVLVCGNPTTRTIVTTASYEARPFGIKSGMSLGEARRLCPQAVLIEADPAKYVATARRLEEMLLEISPKVEVYSIDEAFVEMLPKQDPVAAAKAFKAKLKAAFNLTCSIGIGPNKLVAKLAAGMEKPDGLVWLHAADIPRIFENLAVSELCGIGPRIEKRLQALGIFTLGQLRQTPVSLLRGHFGRCWGEQLAAMSRGEDDSPVVSCLREPVIKSMGHAYTLPADTWEEKAICAHLLRLSLMVGRRLRAEKFAGRTLRLTLRTGDFTTCCRHQTFPRWFYQGRQIYQGGRQILNSFHLKQPVRMLGIAVANLVPYVPQRELFIDNDKLQSLEKVEDAVLNRFGEFSLKPAALLQLSRAGREAGKWSFTPPSPTPRSSAGGRRFIVTR
jgi:DNA polymerase IV